MKKLKPLFLSTFALLLFSCGGSDDTTETVDVVDTYNLLTINSEGTIFLVGNNTGDLQTVGQMSSQSNLLQLATMCRVGSKILTIEASYVPAPNILRIYDLNSNATTTFQIVLPTSLTTTMNDPFITNMNYNGTELIAIVSDNQPNDTHPNKVISINPQTYQTTDLNIDFYQRTLTSTELINNKLYVGTNNDGLLVLDLALKTVTEIQQNGAKFNSTKLAKTTNNKLALMKFGTTSLINDVLPYEFDITAGTFTDKASGNIFAVGNITGKTFFVNNEFLNFVYTIDSKFGLLKVNYNTNEQEFIELNSNTISPNATIVDIISI
jgi:hypothetical protein